MAWNEFESDRGPVNCADCGQKIGQRIDQYAGAVVALCPACYVLRNAPAEPEMLKEPAVSLADRQAETDDEEGGEPAFV